MIRKLAVTLALGFLLASSPASATVPAGTASFRLSPDTISLNPGQTQVVQGLLRTGNVAINGYQLIFTLAYTGPSPAVEILNNQFTYTTDSAQIYCFNFTPTSTSSSITYTLACIDNPGGTSFTTGNQEQPIFNFTLRAMSAGSVTLNFDQTNSKVEDNTGDILAPISPATYSTTVATATPTSTLAPTLPPQSTSVTLNLAVQGLPQLNPLSQLPLNFYLSGVNQYQFTSKLFTQAAGNFYSFSDNTILPGNYQLTFQNPGYLNRSLPITIVTGPNTIDITSPGLRVGDFNCDNALTIADISAIINQYTDLSVPVTAATEKFDVTHDGVIKLADISLILQNYTTLTVNGDSGAAPACVL